MVKSVKILCTNVLCSYSVDTLVTGGHASALRSRIAPFVTICHIHICRDLCDVGSGGQKQNTTSVAFGVCFFLPL